MVVWELAHPSHVSLPSMEFGMAFVKMQEQKKIFDTFLAIVTPRFNWD